jgi:Calcineurin-like phosphoesterase
MRQLTFMALLCALVSSAHAQTWQFAVSGDSRNCGDVVMPAIAAAVGASDAQFYWHLGDFRRIYDFDEDMQAVKATNIVDYENAAWPDFIAQQVAPFTKQVFLAVGNHEVFTPKTLPQYLGQFADWLMQPEIVAQRLKDDPTDHQLKAYYHWIRNGVDFISVDNSAYAFDSAQQQWIETRIAADVADPSIKTIVLGGHAALPHSISCDHSMNQTPAGEQSGVQVYKKLLAAQKAGKKVYLLASHSHFIQTNVFDTDYWRNNGGVLPGWIVGTAGAVRYRLASPDQGRTDVYGYLLATVSPDGSIKFDFKEIERGAIPAATVTRYGAKFVDWCFTDNKDMRVPKPVNCEKNVPCAMP